MAESKGSLLAKSVQKHAGRAKEKVGFQNNNNKPDQIDNQFHQKSDTVT